MTLKKVERTITGLTVILGFALMIQQIFIGIAKALEIKSLSDGPIVDAIHMVVLTLFIVSVALSITLNFSVISRYVRHFVENYSDKKNAS